MNKKTAGYLTSLKLVVGAFLVLCVLAMTANAKPFYTGTFKLTSQVQWAGTVLKPGTYAVSVDQRGSSIRTLTIREMSTGKLVVQELALIDTDTTTTDSKILIFHRGARRAVASMKLAGIGEVFEHSTRDSMSSGAAEEAGKIEEIPVLLAKN